MTTWIPRDVYERFQFVEAFPELVADYSGPYGPDHNQFWIATTFTRDRVIVSREPKRFPFKLVTTPLIRFPRASMLNSVT